MPRPLSIALVATVCFTLTARAEDPDPKKIPGVKQVLEKAEAEVRRNRKAYDDANAKTFLEAEKALREEVEKLSKAGKLEEAVAVKKFADSIGKEVLANVAKKTKPPHPAKTGAVAWNGHKYKVFNDPCSWHDAKKRCEDMDGHLVIINDENEQAFVVNLLMRSGIPVENSRRNWGGFWIGATDEATEGQWVWVDGSPMRYQQWCYGQPDGSGNYPKLCIDHGGGWDDQPVGGLGTSLFICEWDE